MMTYAVGASPTRKRLSSREAHCATTRHARTAINTRICAPPCRCRRTMPAPAHGGNGMNGDEAPQTSFSGGVTLTEGPFAGWTTWSGGSDPYETLIGPFYFREEGGQA